MVYMLLMLRQRTEVGLLLLLLMVVYRRDGIVSSRSDSSNSVIVSRVSGCHAGWLEKGKEKEEIKKKNKRYDLIDEDERDNRVISDNTAFSAKK